MHSSVGCEPELSAGVASCAEGGLQLGIGTIGAEGHALKKTGQNTTETTNLFDFPGSVPTWKVPFRPSQLGPAWDPNRRDK